MKGFWKRRRGRPAGAAGAVLAAASIVWLAIPSIATASSPPAPSGPVALTGEGTWDVNADLLGWQNDLFGTVAAPKINLNYVAQGGPTGLNALLSGEVDYSISGMPFTSSQLAGYPGRASGIIAAPIMPSAVGFLLDPPPAGFSVTNGQTGAPAQYTGQVKVPADNLVAQLFNYGATYQGTSPSNPYFNAVCGDTASQIYYGEWDNPAIISNWDPSFLSQYNPATDQDFFLPCPNIGPQPTYQDEANEDTYYLEQWASEVSPTLWRLLQGVGDPNPTPSNPWVPSPQVQPLTQRGLVFEPGLPESLTAFVNGATAGGGQDVGGVVAPLPPTALALADSLYQGPLKKPLPPPGLGYEWIYVQNGNGDWVVPTPAAIDAAVDATPTAAPTASSGAQPLYAATHAVAGAYPLTYIDYLYAPAHGLSVTKTEALATVIRYLATDGQASLAATGDGELSSALVLQALAAANQLVESNCPKADLIYSAALGPDTPTGLPGLDGLGQEYHCEVPAPSPSASTTTTIVAAKSATTAPALASPSGTEGTPSGLSGNPSNLTTATTLAIGSGSGSSSGRSSGGSGTESLTSSSTRDSRAAGTVGAGGAGVSGSSAPNGSTNRAGPAQARAASALPFDVSAGTQSGLDKLAALVIGMLAFLLVRRLWTGRLSKVVGG